MGRLTQVSFQTRRLIKYGFFFLVFLIVGKTILNFGLTIWKKLNPPPPLPPTVSFGKLPAIKFPEKEKKTDLEFNLETPSGSLPEFPDRAKIFFVPYQQPNLLALDRAKEIATLIGFKNEPKAISGKVYQWTQFENNTLQLEMDIVSSSFILSYDWQNDPIFLKEKILPGKEQAKQEAQNFLTKIKISKEDLANEKMMVNYLKIVGNDLIQALSPSESNFVKVEMFRKNVDELPVLTADPAKGIVSIIISGVKDYTKKIVRVEFNYFPIKYDSWATYPIKSTATAWQELKNGEGFVANWEGTENKVTIRRIYLAYFDSFKPQEFLQPIIVFEGDGNFFGYIPAITSEWHL